MGSCICCCFCGSAVPALEISVGCPPPVNSPFTFQPVTLAPFSLSLLVLHLQPSLTLCCFSALCPLPSMEGLHGLFRFGQGWGFSSLELAQDISAGNLCLATSLPIKNPPFASLSGNIHLTSQIFLNEAAESCMRAGLVCQDPWAAFPGDVQGKGSSPATGEGADPSVLERILYFQACFGRALLTLCHSLLCSLD